MEDIENADENMSVNEMVTTCPARYLNAHMKVTRTVVYNEIFSWVVSAITHSG